MFKFFQVLTIQLFFILAILCLRHIEFKTWTLFWFYPLHTDTFMHKLKCCQISQKSPHMHKFKLEVTQSSQTFASRSKICDLQKKVIIAQIFSEQTLAL